MTQETQYEEEINSWFEKNTKLYKKEDMYVLSNYLSILMMLKLIVLTLAMIISLNT